MIATVLPSTSKESSIAADKRPLFFRFAAAQTIDGCAAKSMDLPMSLVERRKHMHPDNRRSIASKIYDVIGRIQILPKMQLRFG